MTKREVFIMQNINRIGEINYNNKNQKMTIINYRKYDDIDIMFDDNTIVNSCYKSFKKGQIKNPNAICVQNVGYIGIGKYNGYEKYEKNINYTIWFDMLDRCYNVNDKRNISYKDCSVDSEWHNFQNFAKWFEENYYTVNDEIMHIDKDLLFKGNKIYSSTNCIFLPKSLNLLLISNKSRRGLYPIGISYRKTEKIYVARLQKFNKEVYLGCFKTPEKAFEIYKKHKEQHIKDMAELYKSYIPIKAYNALLNWNIEITD